MAFKKTPPPNYFASEYPLPHNFFYSFGLNAETSTQNSTIVSLIRCHEGIATDAIEVNPSHANFAEETGSIIATDSIVPKINISITAQMTHIAAETDVLRYLKFNWMPVYVSFKDKLEALENETNVEVEDILELETTVATKSVEPLYTGTDLIASGGILHPMNTVLKTEVFGDVGLSVDTKMEAVAFDEELMWDTLSYGSNAGALKSIMGSWHSELIHRDRPWFMNSNNFTNPIVKRGNEYTYCGILFHVPLVDTVKQYYQAADVTEANPQISFDVQVRYDEWNPNFDQTTF